MIQDDDDIVVGKITFHIDRLRKEIWYLSDKIVKDLYGKSVLGKKVYEVVILDYYVDAEPTSRSTGNFVLVQIPRELRISTKHNMYTNKKRICDILYERMLKKITENYSVEEHDLHNCSATKVYLLDEWSRYEAQL